MTEKARPAIERRSGVALWRQIADRIRQEIGSGLADPADRLPPELSLAERFGVNRHTVRTAIASLISEGVLRAEQGRGTFVEKRRKLTYPIAERTRFSDGLARQAQRLEMRLLGDIREIASVEVSAALQIEEGATVIRLDTVSQADGRPVSRARSWFDAQRFPRLPAVFSDTGSITAALKAHGVEDYFRRSTSITAHHADAEDLETLGLSPGAIVMVAIAINVDANGRPVQFSKTRFAADRIELHISGSDKNRLTGK